MKTIILGAGFTGLAAGIKTKAPIYEASGQPGGICRDYEQDGFKFSNGGPHWIFGKDAGLEYIKSLVEVKEYERKAGVYYNHIFPYPFQTTARDSNSIVGGDEFSLKYWLLETFGIEQCNLFFFPFNEKYTAGLYKEVIQADEYKSPKSGSGWVSTFCDPVNGLSDLVNKMAEKCTIMYNNPAVSIDTHNKIVKFKYTTEKYDRLISTIPLSNLMEMCGEKANLPYTSVLVVNIGGDPGPSLPKEHWLYIPFCKTGFHRVSFYTNVDPSKAPKGKVGLSIERAFYNTKYEDLNVAEIGSQMAEEIAYWGWIRSVDVAKADWIPCAYTWLYKEYDADNAINWLAERDIISTGRYGKWKFQGLTQSIMDGFNVE